MRSFAASFRAEFEWPARGKAADLFMLYSRLMAAPGKEDENERTTAQLEGRSMPKKQKLNSMRLLEANRIPYEVFSYDSCIRDARQVAESVGLPARTVFKTLVAQVPSDRKPILVMLPSDTTLNLKALAKSLGVKKAALASQADAEKMTGLQVGGISAIALMQKNWDVYLDQRGSELEHIVISAGQRGLQLRVAAPMLIALLGCNIIDVADEKDGGTFG